MNIDEENNKKEPADVGDDKKSKAMGGTDKDCQKSLDVGGGCHPLDLIHGSEALSACLKAQWIDTVEQAVGYLVAVNIEIDGKEPFLAQAKEILGEEAYLKYSTLPQRYSLGCLKATREVQDEKQLDDDVTEEKGATDAP